MSEVLEIDGSEGEGGGQIIRTSLTLSLISGRPIRITNIRAGRAKPGLGRQHLVAVRAAAEIGAAEVSGDELRSLELKFRPRTVTGGAFDFNIGSAGSCTLVLQTLIPALLHAQEATRLTIRGGTHNPWAPSYEFLSRVYTPLINRMGPQVAAKLERSGFYPKGGGVIECQIDPAPELHPFDLTERGRLIDAWCEARVSQLPFSIAEREADTIRRLAGWPKGRTQAVEVASDGPGNVLLIGLQFETNEELVAGIGEKGVPAERVARTAWKEVKALLEAECPVGPHLADQWMLPAALAAAQGKASRFRTMPLTLHATTHKALLEKFLNVRVRCEQCDKGQVEVRLDPADFAA